VVLKNNPGCIRKCTTDGDMVQSLPGLCELELEEEDASTLGSCATSIILFRNSKFNSQQHSIIEEEDEDDIRKYDIAPLCRLFCFCCPCFCCFAKRHSYHSENDDDSTTRSSLPTFFVNKNVLIILIVSFLYSFLDSFWDGAVFATFLLEVDSSRIEYVGYFEGTRAFSNLISYLIIEWSANKYGQCALLKFGGVLNLITIGLHTSLLIWIGDGKNLSNDEIDTIFGLYFLVMALEGVLNSVLQGPVIALFSQSTPLSFRSDCFVLQYMQFVMASSFGPALSIIFFAFLGNEWELTTLKTIIFVGMGLQISVSIALFSARKEWVLDDVEQRIGVSEDSSLERIVQDIPEDTVLPEPQNDSHTALINKQQFIIPLILFFSSFLISSGSGLTIRYFPLYFKNELDLKPIAVQIIYASIPLSVAFGTSFIRLVTSFTGHVPVIFSSRLTAVLALFIISYASDSITPAILVLLYILRMICMNSTHPIAQSLMMDNCVKNKRNTWKKIESLASLGWAVCAVIGGVLVDRYVCFSYSLFLLLLTFIS